MSARSWSCYSGTLPVCCEAIIGTIDAMSESPAFDTALYVDVLEHIKDDRMKLERAARNRDATG